MSDNTHRRRFPGLSSEAFEHPTDRSALQALRAAPGLDWAFRKFNEFTNDRAAKLYCLSDTVCVSPRQFPTLHAMLAESCEILDMPAPGLYVDQNPIANACTFGVDSPVIVLNSGMLELLDEDEWRVLLGHELGHVKSGHVMYRQIAQFLAHLFQLVGGRTLGLGRGVGMGVFAAFFHWYRQSELTADRAALLVSQDPDAVLNSLMKLAGGSRRLFAQMDRQAFLDQGREYEELGKDFINQLYNMGRSITATHPFPAVRALEAEAWSKSDQWKAILDGNYPRRAPKPITKPRQEPGPADVTDSARKCPRCMSTVRYSSFLFCPECGADL
ncbi:MAG: M48 family metallopeptidase [Capsulimonadaceae bacterium]